MQRAAGVAAATAAVADGPNCQVAPYALIRVSAVDYPAQQPPGYTFRTALRRLVVLEAAAASSSTTLCDALHDSSAGHDRRFHHDVVLPTRRAVHNGRAIPAALRERLGDLPRRLPALADWLARDDERAALLAELPAVVDAALAAERAALSRLCADQSLARAAALTSPDLLRAMERATASLDGAQDRRGRKAEPGVLRYALRASTKTSPLSWFTAVGWGQLPDPDPDATLRTWGQLDWPRHRLSATARPGRPLVELLVGGLLQDRRYHDPALPYRLASTPRSFDGRVEFARCRAQATSGRFLTWREDELGLTDGAPLALVVALAQPMRQRAELAAALADRLPGGRAGSAVAADAFIDRLVELGVLTSCWPIDPQDPDPLPALARWLRRTGTPHGLALADRIAELAAATSAFTATLPHQRYSLLRELSLRWQAVLTDVAVPARQVVAAAAAPVVTEDVVARRPVPLHGYLGPADHAALREITPVADLFDLGHAMRHELRQRFVASYGHGGSCDRVWEFGPQVRQAWAAVGGSAGAADVEAARAELLATRELGTDPDADVVLSEQAVRLAASRLPARLLARPTSYSFFVQRDPDTGWLCVNQISGGWGRFTSRFLHLLDPAATAQVAARVRAGLGGGARVVQARPVGGFGANVHPRLVEQTWGEDPRWAELTDLDVQLYHDLSTDQVRLRVRESGEPLDVLYPGFLAPVMLPDRLAPVLNDQPAGTPRFTALLPTHSVPGPAGPVLRTPRLRYRGLVLERRRWVLPVVSAQALRADLRTADLRALARWRALLGLPEQVFIRSAPPPVAAGSGGRSADSFLAYLQQPKPQFVDLGNALHVHCLGRWLGRHPAGLIIEEALPAAGGRGEPSRTVELVVETYRAGQQP